MNINQKVKYLDDSFNLCYGWYVGRLSKDRVFVQTNLGIKRVLICDLQKVSDIPVDYRLSLPDPVFYLPHPDQKDTKPVNYKSCSGFFPSRLDQPFVPTGRPYWENDKIEYSIYRDSEA